MNDEQLSIDKALHEAYWMENGDAKIALLEEIIRRADVSESLDKQIEARMDFIQAAVFGGADDKALVAFSWCLAHYDKNPELISEFDILWKYKWIAAHVADFPQITKKQLADLINDMTARYNAAGANLRPVYQNQYRIARATGEKARADEFFNLWLKSKRDYHSDCAACELSTEIGYLIEKEQDSKALKKVKPILDGKLSCATIPHTTYALILLPLVRLRRGDEAMQFHLKGYRMVARDKDFLEEIGLHIRFLTLAGNYTKALTLLGKHLSWALEKKSAEPRFQFYRSVWLLFSVLNDAGRPTVKLRLPKDFAGFQESGKYVVADLLAEFEQMILTIVADFNRRNENDYYTDLFKAAQDWKKYQFTPEKAA